MCTTNKSKLQNPITTCPLAKCASYGYRKQTKSFEFVGLSTSVFRLVMLANAWELHDMLKSRASFDVLSTLPNSTPQHTRTPSHRPRIFTPTISTFPPNIACSRCAKIVCDIQSHLNILRVYCNTVLVHMLMRHVIRHHPANLLRKALLASCPVRVFRGVHMVKRSEHGFENTLSQPHDALASHMTPKTKVIIERVREMHR